jgi:hypothetical protein
MTAAGAVRALAVVLALLAAAAVAQAPKEEELDLDALVAEEKTSPAASANKATRVPEHDYDRRLLAFPALLILILAWNVKWTPGPPPPKRTI